MSFPLSGASDQLRLVLGAAILASWLSNVGPAQAQDARHGQAVFNSNCAICHSVSPGRNIIGPSLFNVVGRHAGTLAGFSYSPAMRASSVVWAPANLDTWLISPRAFVPKTRMSFPGLHTPNDRADVIAYLEKQK